MKNIFVTSKITIDNTTTYIKSVSIFLVILHIFACSWIWIGFFEDEWMGDDREIFITDIKTTYVEAFYFITTTMTQVGYGDVTVFGFGVSTMITIIIIEFGGILGFSIIK